MNLTDEQKLAVNLDAPIKVIIASPGSGKTHCLCSMIEKAVTDDGVPAARIAVVCFTNHAAWELQDRISEAGVDGLGWCGTLHGMLFKLLTEHGSLIGLPRNLTVVDDDQREGLVTDIMADMGLKVPVSRVLAAISGFEPVSKVPVGKEHLVALEYNLRTMASGMVDFNSILHHGLLVVRLLGKRFPFTHLFVDEAQDMARADLDVYQDAVCERKVFIGDCDQGIYAFRGGNPAYLLSLANPPGAGGEGEKLASNDSRGQNGAVKAVVSLLETNYRCGSVICEAAEWLIGHNKTRWPKRCQAVNRGGAVEVYECANPSGEAARVLAELDDYPLTTAVLARTNRVAEAAAEYLRAAGVKVNERRAADDPPDWRRTKILLSALANPWNDLAVYRWLVESRGPEDAKTIKLHSAKACKGINEFLDSPLKTTKESGLGPQVHLNGVSAESRDRVHDACRLLSSRGPWTLPELVLFLASGERKKPEDGDGVTVSTIHQAKGREWDTVFVVGCEEGLLPMTKAGTDTEEERRLMFVAMTRAKSRLVLTWSRERTPPFGKEPESRTRSRFVTEAGL